MKKMIMGMIKNNYITGKMEIIARFLVLNKTLTDNKKHRKI